MMISVFTLVLLATSNAIIYSHASTNTLKIQKKMCKCAREYDACEDTCPDLFGKPNLSAVCSNYAAEGLCGGSFPSDVPYKEYCATIGVPCTTSQQMCKCADENFLCDKTCRDLFNVDDVKCADYAASGICGGEFPSDAKYEDHCPGVGMTCGRKSTDVHTTCADVGEYWFLQWEYCTVRANAADEPYAKFWEVKKGTKEDVLALPCPSGSCTLDDCCQVGRERTCMNTRIKGGEGEFKEKMCGDLRQLKPELERETIACGGNDGFKCRKKDCCDMI